MLQDNKALPVLQTMSLPSIPQMRTENSHAPYAPNVLSLLPPCKHIWIFTRTSGPGPANFAMPGSTILETEMRMRDPYILASKAKE